MKILQMLSIYKLISNVDLVYFRLWNSFRLADDSLLFTVKKHRIEFDCYCFFKNHYTSSSLLKMMFR